MENPRRSRATWTVMTQGSASALLPEGRVSLSASSQGPHPRGWISMPDGSLSSQPAVRCPVTTNGFGCWPIMRLVALRRCRRLLLD
jgi:hypothetical protein